MKDCIKISALEEIILRAIHKVTALALRNEEDFIPNKS